MAERKDKKRVYGLDIFRVLCVLMVFLFHSHIHIRSDYGVCNQFIELGAIYMTAFFLLSGYVISLVYNKLEMNGGGVISFYKKRFIGIIPSYWGVAVLYTFFHIVIFYVQGDYEGITALVKNTLLLLPVETLGLQSTFSSLFTVIHNGGTWFVSCMVFCYLAFPLLKVFADGMKDKNIMILILLLWFILVYSAVISQIYETDRIYTNIVYRIFEFTIGMLLFHIKLPEGVEKLLTNWWAFAIEVVLLYGCIYCGQRLELPNDFMLYNWCALPLFALMIITLSNIKETRFLKSKFLSYASEISYMLFFAQMFTWDPTIVISRELNLTDNNLFRILLSFAICIIVAILLHEFLEKPLKKLFQKKLLKAI